MLEIVKLTYTYTPVLSFSHLLSLPIYLIEKLSDAFAELEKKYFKLTIDRILAHFIYGLSGEEPPDSKETVNLIKNKEVLSVLQEIAKHGQETTASSSEETTIRTKDNRIRE